MASRTHARARPWPQRLVLPLLLLVVVGVATAVAWTTMTEHKDAAPATSASGPTPTTTGPTGGASPSSTRPPSASPSPSAKPSRSATPSGSPSASPSASRSASPTPTRSARSYRVVVLNATGRTGLAARTAAGLEDDGWTVTGIGNWSERPPSTTVYYPDGAEAAAQELAADLGVERIRPAYAALPSGRLVVVLG